MMSLEDILNLESERFFEYVSSLRYGYCDKHGKIHLATDVDFTVNDYSFSSPETIVKNNCGWCWDIAEFIKLYCKRKGIPCKSYFMEYLSDELHQTHAQVFILYREKWSAAPDNCLGLSFGTPCYNDPEACIGWFSDLFTDYLKSTLKDKYSKENLIIKEYTCSIPAGISDDDYLAIVRR